MSVSGAGSVLANAFALSIPGTFVTIIEPGEKPSARFQSVGSIGLPAMLRGIPSTLKSTRRPVCVDASLVVKKSLGNGSMHAAGSIGSQPVWVGEVAAVAGAAAARAANAARSRARVLMVTWGAFV